MNLCGYSFGQDVASLPELSEFTDAEYQTFRKTYPDERAFKAPAVVYAEHGWEVLIGTRGADVYKIFLQHLSEAPMDAFVAFVRAEVELRKTFGFGEASGASGAKFWKLENGELILEAGVDPSASRFVDLIATRREWGGFCYHDCPQCIQQIRVPSRKGNIRIKCPKCSCQFVRET